MLVARQLLAADQRVELVVVPNHHKLLHPGPLEVTTTRHASSCGSSTSAASSTTTSAGRATDPYTDNCLFAEGIDAWPEEMSSEWFLYVSTSAGVSAG